MAANKVDEWFVELELLSVDDSPKTVRVMTRNATDPEKTAETVWDRDVAARARLIYGAKLTPDHADWCLQQLDDYGQVTLEVHSPDASGRPATYKASELVLMGFSPDDLEL